MVDPGVALAVFATFVVLLGVLLWPRKGIAARISRMLRLTSRVRVEDALKHLHDLDYRGQQGTLDSVAGALEIGRGKAVDVVAQLEGLRLVQPEGQELSLTELGRAEARRILRSHRLWERYLADRTSVAPVDWHEEAEQREHTTPLGKVERLSASMGHPVYDPHGDPIPTASGRLPPRTGVAVAALDPGETASIVHLEDEPREVYERLVAHGLALGTAVQLVEVTPTNVRLLADGEEHDLEPVVAANITVARKGPDRTAPAVAQASLSDLQPGESGVVRDIAPTCPGPQRRRLLDLGLVPGTPVRAELRGAIQGAVAYRIRDALIALRRDQATMVRMEPGAGSTSVETV
jgi:DtxR family Mn-dependent transcriptional regulator